MTNLKSEDLKKALDASVKRASKKDVAKLRKGNKAKVEKIIAPTQRSRGNMAKKEKQENNNDEAPPKRTSGIDLSDIVRLKKQKAVANELDEYIYAQESKKKAREKGETPPATPPTQSPIAMALAADPDKIQEMDMNDIMKFQMLTGNQKGSVDPLMYMMLMGNQQNSNKSDSPPLMQQLMSKIILDKFEKGEQKTDNGNDTILKFMMIMMQNMMTNQNKPAATPPQHNPFESKLLELVAYQNRSEKDILMNKIKELEYRTNQSDPLGDAKRMLEYVKTFGSVLGAGNQTPERLDHDYKMRKLDHDVAKEERIEAVKEARMHQVGDMINKSIGTFAEILSKPAAEAVAGKLNSLGQNAQGPPPQENYEVDLEGGDIDLDQFSPSNLDFDSMTSESDLDKKKGRMRIYSSEQ